MHMCSSTFCYGTKTLRKQPGEFHYQHMLVMDCSAHDL